MSKKFQVLGMGNAIVDVLASCDDAFLADMDITKGIMNLVDGDRSRAIYSRMGNTEQMSGGSGANTIAALAGLGVSSSLIGMVKDDELGHVFSDDMAHLGVDFPRAKVSAEHHEETARCMVLITPDGERSMNTYLGVSVYLAPENVDEKRVTDTEWLYLEGYLFDSETNQAAFYKAIDLAKGSGAKVSLTLSDPFCVDRHRAGFRDLVDNHVDLLFCNEDELASLYEVPTAQDAFAHCKPDQTVACTASERGVYIAHGGAVTHVPTTSAELVDATGAGDAFAAGYLYGVVSGKDAAECGRLGNVLAGEAISHVGARAQVDLKALVRA